MAGRGLNPMHPFQAVPAIISRLAEGATGLLGFYIIKNRYYIRKIVAYVGRAYLSDGEITAVLSPRKIIWGGYDMGYPKQKYFKLQML